MESHAEVDLELEFTAFRRDGDVEALARVFDATAPGLLSVARHLAHGAAEAEDLVQQTFVTAIERAATFDPSRNLLAWLTGILALHARKDVRQSARAVDPDRLPTRETEDPHAAVQSAEFRAAVDAAVVALPDRYSEVLRLHLREQLAPREIARRLGLDATTARVQLHRGLKMLREALPAGIGTHAVVAIPARGLPAVRAEVLFHGARFVPAAPVVTVAASGIGLWLGVLAAAVLALVVGVATWTGNSASSNDEPAVALATGIGAAPELALAEPDSTTVAAPATTSTREPVAVAAATSGVSTARVAGRLLLPSGAPAVGAEVSLSGWNANQERVIEFPPPKDWEPPPRVSTDADGRFTIEVDLPRAFQSSVDARLEGHASLSWRWHEIPPGARIDVGERRFALAQTMYVRVLGPDGAPLSGIRFQVSATPAGGKWGTSPYETQAIVVNAQYDEQDEIYVLNGLPPGAAKIQARSDATEWLQPRVVMVGSGEPSHVDLVYTGPDASKRIVVSWTSRPFFTFRPELRYVHLRQVGVPDRTPANIPGIALSTAFDDLEPGPYSVVIDDPRFEPFVQHGVEPGTRVRAKLRGSAALRVVVTNGPDRIESEPELLTLKYVDVRWSPSEFDLLQPELLPIIDGYRTGIVPGVCLLRVRVPGAPEMRVELGEILPGEQREVVVDVSKRITLRGRVLDGPNGGPSVGVRAMLTRGTAAGHGLETGSPVQSNRLLVPKADVTTRTSDQGSFEFHGLQPGTWTLRVAWSPWLYTDRTLELAASPAEEIVLAAPASGWLDVEFLVPDGAQYDGVDLGLFLLDGSGGNHLDSLLQPAFSFPLTAGERAHVGPLAPGLYSASAIVRSRGIGIALEGREILIAGGATANTEFDLREYMFGRLVLQARTGGRGPIAAGVRVLRVQGNEWGVTGQALDPDGGTVLGGVAPGIVQFEVHALDESWSWTDPRSIELAPGQERELVIDVPWIERAIVVRDANGAPLARTAIEFGLGEPAERSGTGWSSLRTDDTGRATIALPPGTARLRFANGTTRTIAWSADLPDEVAVVEGV